MLSPPSRSESQGDLGSSLKGLVSGVTKRVRRFADNLMSPVNGGPPHPEFLTGGLLQPADRYTRTQDVGKYTRYFVAQTLSGQHVLVREVPPFACDAQMAHTLARLSRELPHIQPLIDIISAPGSRTYLVLQHPQNKWYFLSDQQAAYAPQRAIEWGQQIGLTLRGLHELGYSLGEERRTGLEKILIDGTEAKISDLSTCAPFSENAAQKHRATLDDLRFLGRVLYRMAVNRNLTQDLQNPQVAHLPRSLSVAILSSARGNYVSVAEMLQHLGGQNLPPLQLSSGKATHQGLVRDHNEDQFFVYEVSQGRTNQPLPAFYMVADGMGGYEAGEIASDTISAALKAWLDEYSTRRTGRATQKLGELPRDALALAIEEGNLAVVQQARARGNRMGTTVTAALVVGETAFVANVGDSRTYLYRGGELRAITEDHSLVYSLVKAGQLTVEEIYTHPQRNQVYRSLGEKTEIQVDVFDVPLLPGDRLLLCSDGLWEMVRDPQIAAVLAKALNPQEACEELVALANRGGGEDNITAVLVQVR
jgi:protein phosphatase